MIGVSPRYLLDAAGDAVAEENVESVRTEADFLRYALDNKPLLIHGAKLTQWAEVFASGRGIPVKWLQSPSAELQQLVPNFDSSATTLLFQRWPELLEQADLRKNVTTVTAHMLGGLAPNTPQHAAQWLLLRINADNALQEVLYPLGQALSQSVWDEWKPIYAAAPEDTEGLLLAWVGLKNTQNQWPAPFAAELKGKAEQRAQEVIRNTVAELGVDAFQHWQASSVAVTVLKLGAVATADWLMHHPDHLNRTTVQRLRDYLPTKTYENLMGKVPVNLPAPLPEDPQQWSAWMQRDYLPYRTSSNADHSQLLPTLQHFAELFLKAYSKALNVGTHAEHLVWQRTAALKQSRVLTLVVICDGLGLHDLAILQRHLTQQDTGQRLSDCGVEVAFPALPTITHEAKPALERGVAPSLSGTAKPLGPMFTQETKVEAALHGGKPGDIVFWNYCKTDKLYHDAGTLAQARTEANATLMALAERILELMLKAIPQDVPAQLVITTDHGRLLMPSQRTVAPPPDFRPEGRAAFGRWNDIPASGFKVDEQFALLGRTTFGMTEDAAVMWGNQMFFTANGATGSEVCPHGGITPEEVLIPWAVYARDLEFRLPTFEITGKGEAEQPGTLEIKAVNPNQVPLSVSAVSGSLGEVVTLPLPWTLPANDVTQLQIPLAKWPKSAELPAFHLRLSVRAGEGAAQDIDAQINLQTEELYSSTSDILDDLL